MTPKVIMLILASMLLLYHRELLVKPSFTSSPAVLKLHTPCESSNSKTCPSGSCTVKVYSPHGFWLGASTTGKPTSCKCWYNPSTSDVPNSTCVAPYFNSPNNPLPTESRANSPGRYAISSTPGIIL